MMMAWTRSAKRLASVAGTAYNFADNGNRLTTGSMTDTWDAAEIAGSSQPLAVSYDGLRWALGPGQMGQRINNG